MNERSTAGRLDRWLRFEQDGVVTVLTGKVEIGQGVASALARCVADELDLPFERVAVPAPDTEHSPDEGFTAGSRSIEETGELLRSVAAEVRALLVDRAAARLGADRASLTVSNGTIGAPSGARLAYAELVDDELLAREATGSAPTKPAAARQLIGRRVPRLDLEAKIVGAPAYVQDLVLPGMLHARVVRPPSPAARLVSLPEDELRRLPGVVAVVRDGSFVGIVAEREEQAIAARQHARRVATWDERPTLPPGEPRYLLAEPTEDSVASESGDVRASGAGDRTISAEYTRPFIAHGALAPSCAVARLDDGAYTVWSHTQGIHPLQTELRKVLGSEQVRVIHLDGAGCYGHNGADDAALDAALLARAVPGRPVRVQWMRDDEFAWEPYGTSTVVRVEARLADDGSLAAWRQEMWEHGHGNRPGRAKERDTSALLAAQHLERAFRPTVPGPARSLTSASLRNALPLYRIPAHRIVDHYVPRQPLRVSALRSLGAHPNVFAIESLMDELAVAAGTDPVTFRLAHLEDPRAREVIETAVARSGWSPGRGGTRAGEVGHGLGFARYKNLAAYFACVAEVRLEQDIRVTRVWGAIDPGMAVDPDGVINQAEGGIVQATSWTLREQVGHDDTRIQSLGWDTYTTLRFSEVPEVEVVLIDRPDEPPLGVGEAFAGPVSAAIANAVYDAAGVRLRDLPLTRERLIAALG